METVGKCWRTAPVPTEKVMYELRESCGPGDDGDALPWEPEAPKTADDRYEEALEWVEENFPNTPAG